MPLLKVVAEGLSLVPEAVALGYGASIELCRGAEGHPRENCYGDEELFHIEFQYFLLAFF